MITTYCQQCKHKAASVNVQKLWVKWSLDSRGDTTGAHDMLDEEPREDENLFLCDGCYSLWSEGEMQP